MYYIRQNRSILMIVLWICLGILFTNPTYAQQKKVKKVNIHYFYSNVCKSCTEALDTIHDYMGTLAPEENEYELVFVYYNVVESYNFEKMQQYFDTYQVPKEDRHYPIMFYGQNYYQGAEAIEQAIDIIDKDLENETLQISEEVFTDYSIENSTSQLGLHRLLQVIFIGLINGLNPCALSMLLFLITLCMSRKGIHIVKVGAAFAMGKVITYILLGTIMYRFLSVVNMDMYSKVTKIVLSIYLIFIIGMNLLDWYNAKKQRYGHIRNQLPSGFRKFNHNMIQRLERLNKTSSLMWMSILLGSIISIGEFLCTGQVYVATIVYLYQSDTLFSLRAFVYLCLYSISFIVPLMVIVYIIHKTRTTMSISTKLVEKLPLIKLITAVALGIIGVMVIVYT